MMSRRSLTRVLTGAALSLCVAVPALLAADAPVMLQRTAKKGDLLRYQSDISGKIGEVTFTVAAVSKTETTDVKENGDVVAVTTEESSKVEAMGAEQPSKLTPPITVTRDKLGKIKNADGELGDGMVFTRELALVLLELDQPVLSDKPVTVAQTWETERDNPLVNGKKFLLKTTLEAVEKDGNKTLWKVKQVADLETTEAEMLKSESTFWLDSANGQVVKLESSVSGLPSQLGLVTWTEKRVIQK